MQRMKVCGECEGEEYSWETIIKKEKKDIKEK